MDVKNNDKVLIIGGGLGGLTLAQVLWRNNVPFELFERDHAPAARKQGWAVALVESLPALEKLLPPDMAQKLPQNSVNFHTGDYDELAFADGLTGEKIGAVGKQPYGEPGSILRVGREHFRTFLWESNDLPVSSGKHFTHYTEDEEGVTAYFEDGTTTRGSLLIGADGAHSAVMNQLVGESNHRLELSQQVPIFGEVELPPALYEPLRSCGNAVILLAAPKIREMIGMLSMADDKSTAYFFWALMLQRDYPDELVNWLQTASRKEIYEFAMDSTKDLDPVTREHIRFGGPDAIVQPQPKFVEFVTPETLPKGRVTALGDAAHAMVPLRGAGANTALLDACDLAELLINARDSDRDSASVVEPYHELMIPRGRENVLSSRAAGADSAHPAEDFKKMFERH